MREGQDTRQPKADLRHGAVQPVSCPGGSPYQIYQNEQLAAAKRLALPQKLTPGEKLTAGTLQRIRGRCRAEWTAMSAEQKAPFSDLHRARLVERRTAAAKAATRANQPGEHRAVSARSHWNYGSENFAVHPKFVQEALVAQAALPSLQEVHNITEFAVQAPEDAPMLGEGVVLEACVVLARNLCKQHPHHPAVTRLHLAMKTMCDKLGKAVANSGDVLILFEGSKSRHR